MPTPSEVDEKLETLRDLQEGGFRAVPNRLEQREALDLLKKRWKSWRRFQVGVSLLCCVGWAIVIAFLFALQAGFVGLMGDTFGRDSAISLWLWIGGSVALWAIFLTHDGIRSALDSWWEEGKRAGKLADEYRLTYEILSEEMAE